MWGAWGGCNLCPFPAGEAEDESQVPARGHWRLILETGEKLQVGFCGHRPVLSLSGLSFPTCEWKGRSPGRLPPPLGVIAPKSSPPIAAAVGFPAEGRGRRAGVGGVCCLCLRGRKVQPAGQGFAQGAA